MSHLSIRKAGREDIAIMRALELDAAQRYRELPDHAFCADLPARSWAEHERVAAEGCGFVAVLEGALVGFLLALPIDDAAHVLEVGVSLGAQGRGAGRALFEAFHGWARSAGFDRATLTTYRDVPWNRPYYLRLGYADLAPSNIGEELAELIAEERLAGLSIRPRVVMGKSWT